jgi:hypothetical protein
MRAGTAGGDGGCGPDLNKGASYGSFYDAAALRAAQQECRSRAAAAVAASSGVQSGPGVERAPQPQGDPTGPVYVQPEYKSPAASQAYVPYVAGGSPGPAPLVAAMPETFMPAADTPAPPQLQKAPGLQQSPVTASIDVPTEVWVGLTVVASLTVLGGIFLATRHKSPKSGRKAA